VEPVKKDRREHSANLWSREFSGLNRKQAAQLSRRQRYLIKQHMQVKRRRITTINNEERRLATKRTPLRKRNDNR
jgi:hypothetical protein